MGHILCQKHCSCPDKNNLNCCEEGWKVCSVGSRFCNNAKSNYSPTDGEFTALVDALEKTAYFTFGCSDLTVGTDHKPLISIVNETSLSELKIQRCSKDMESESQVMKLLTGYPAVPLPPPLRKIISHQWSVTSDLSPPVTWLWQLIRT